jgi:beta-carotene 3-hydroxylase
MIAVNLVALIVSFAAMESVAWLAHKYLMHGAMWHLHADHHKKNTTSFLEKNDYFFLIFATPGIACVAAGSFTAYTFLLYIGLGITLYGITYFFIHDVFIHQRLPFFRNSDNAYLRALRRAHKMHHKHTEKEDGECFGMLVFPFKYLQRELNNKGK